MERLGYVSFCISIILLLGQLTLRIHEHSGDSAAANCDDNSYNSNNNIHTSLYYRRKLLTRL